MIKGYLDNEFSNKWFKIILNNKDIYWNLYEICSNKNITIEIINNNPNERLDWNCIS